MRRPGAGLFLLFLQVSQAGLHRIGPATGLVMALCVGIFYLPAFLPIPHELFLALMPTNACIGSRAIWERMQWQRLVVAPLVHADEMHLVYNMGSLLWKGMQLEQRMGTKRFGALLLVFTLLSSALMVVGSVVLAEFLHVYSFYHECAVGFSAVLFALKVVLFHESPNSYHHVSFLPFLVPGKYVAWVELAIIQLLVPRASFFGHLCGILAGLIYVSGALGPLFDLLDRLSLEDGNVPAGAAAAHAPPRRGFYGHGAVGQSQERNSNPEQRYYQRRDAFLQNGVLRRR